MKLGKANKTARGFPNLDFKDYYGKDCSLQASSIILSDEGSAKPGTSALWVGLEDADPKIMARHAASWGIKTTETCGWVPYTLIPHEVSLNTRMHLSREQVAGLIKRLQEWLDTGKFK